MNKSFLNHSIFFILSIVAAFIIYSCSDDTTTNNNNPVTYDQNSINGRITFVETGFVDSGSYIISAYPEAGWPPMGPPTSYDTLNIVASQTTYDYKLVGLSNGKYVVSVGFRKLSGGASPVMGIYGCDTSHSFSCLLAPTLKAEITGDAGVGNINFLSWADTTNKIY